MEIALIYVTYSNREEAEKIVSHLLKEKLIACTNYVPVESCYWWKDQVETSDEVVTLMKTQVKHWERIKSEITQLHSYDTPCMLKMVVETNKEFGTWVVEETR